MLLGFVAIGMVLEDSRGLDIATRIVALAMLVGWYYGGAKAQMAYVRARFGEAYPRRGWARPLLVTLGIAIAFFFALFVVAVVATVVQRET